MEILILIILAFSIEHASLFCTLFCNALYLVSFLVLQASRWGKEGLVFYFISLFASVWPLVFAVPWVGLQCVVVAFPEHTNFFIFKDM